LEEFLKDIDVNRKIILTIIVEHLKGLIKNFNHYYLDKEDPRKENLWIHNPFTEDVNSYSISNQEKEKLIDLSTDPTLVSRVEIYNKIFV